MSDKQNSNPSTSTLSETESEELQSLNETFKLMNPKPIHECGMYCKSYDGKTCGGYCRNYSWDVK